MVRSTSRRQKHHHRSVQDTYYEHDAVDPNAFDQDAFQVDRLTIKLQDQAVTQFGGSIGVLRTCSQTSGVLGRLRQARCLRWARSGGDGFKFHSSLPRQKLYDIPAKGTTLARRPLSFNFSRTLPVATRFRMSRILAPIEASRMFRSVPLLVRVG